MFLVFIIKCFVILCLLVMFIFLVFIVDDMIEVMVKVGYEVDLFIFGYIVIIIKGVIKID